LQDSFQYPEPTKKQIVINYGHVTEFIEDGKVVAYLQDPSGAYPEASGETETAERLYIQSLHAKGLGWLSK
jgi:hypothetical protein